MLEDKTFKFWIIFTVRYNQTIIWLHLYAYKNGSKLSVYLFERDFMCAIAEWLDCYFAPMVRFWLFFLGEKIILCWTRILYTRKQTKNVLSFHSGPDIIFPSAFGGKVNNILIMLSLSVFCIQYKAWNEKNILFMACWLLIASWAFLTLLSLSFGRTPETVTKIYLVVGCKS